MSKLVGEAITWAYSTGLTSTQVRDLITLLEGHKNTETQRFNDLVTSKMCEARAANKSCEHEACWRLEEIREALDA